MSYNKFGISKSNKKNDKFSFLNIIKEHPFSTLYFFGILFGGIIFLIYFSNNEFFPSLNQDTALYLIFSGFLIGTYIIIILPTIGYVAISFYQELLYDNDYTNLLFDKNSMALFLYFYILPLIYFVIIPVILFKDINLGQGIFYFVVGIYFLEYFFYSKSKDKKLKLKKYLQLFIKYICILALSLFILFLYILLILVLFNTQDIFVVIAVVIFSLLPIIFKDNNFNMFIVFLFCLVIIIILTNNSNKFSNIIIKQLNIGQLKLKEIKLKNESCVVMNLPSIKNVCIYDDYNKSITLVWSLGERFIFDVNNTITNKRYQILNKDIVNYTIK